MEQKHCVMTLAVKDFGTAFEREAVDGLGAVAGLRREHSAAQVEVGKDLDGVRRMGRSGRRVEPPFHAAASLPLATCPPTIASVAVYNR